MNPACVVVPAVGPYTGNVTGARISKIGPRGFRTTVVDNLPSSQTSADSGSLISGVADVAFIGDSFMPCSAELAARMVCQASLMACYALIPTAIGVLSPTSAHFRRLTLSLTQIQTTLNPTEHGTA